MKGRRKKDLNAEEEPPPPPPPPPIGQFPWLVYDRSKKYPNQILFSPKPEVPPIDIYHQRISALKQKKVFSCSYGYLVLYDYKHRLFSLFNCTNFDTTPLPKLNLKPTITIDNCILSSSPKCPNSKVLVFLENCQSLMCFRITSNGWTEIRYGNQLREAILLGPRVYHGWDRMTFGGYKEEGIPYLCFCDPVICRSKIYAKLKISNIKSPGLWSIEILDKEEGPVALLMLSRLDPPRLKDEFVVELDGELYRVSVHLGKTGDISEVELIKLSRDGRVRERVDSLNNRSFFICQDYSVSCPTPGLDCVFFTKDLSLYTYNLEEDCLSLSLPFGTSSRPIQNHPFWMIPEVLIRKEEDSFNQEQYEDVEEARLLDYEEEVDEEKTLLTDLPLDALDEVAKLLNPLDYLSFRSLSRRCRLAAPLINWRERTDLSSSPLHMFAVKFRSLYRFVHPLRNRAQSNLMTVPDCLKDAKVHYSNHGWLLMTARRSGTVHSYMYNPFTKDIRSYDGPEFDPQVSFFTSKPSSSTCVLIHVTNHSAYTITASTLYPWVRCNLAYSELRGADNSPSPVLFGNTFYFLGKDGELTRFYVKENEITTFYDRRIPPPPCRTCHQNFLVECGGDLLSIFVGHMGKWIRVYKLDESEWETVSSLKGYALYLSQASSFSEVASPGMDNRIYFPRFRDGGALYYAMDRAKWKFVGSEETLCDFSGTELQLHSCWIKPTWS